MSETFDLIFKSEGEPQQYRISEPEGYDSGLFVLKQENNRFARDVSYSDGEADFTFNEYQEHQLKKILYYNDRFGFESEVSLKITHGDNVLILDFDFQNSTTDGLTFFKCKLIQEGSLQIVKRNEDVKVNLFGTKDLFGNDIDPIETHRILLKAKPVVQTSKWKYGLSEPKVSSAVTDMFYNYSNAVVESEIENTLSYIQGKYDPESFAYVEFQNTVKDVKIKLTNINVSVALNTHQLIVRVGAEFNTANQTILQTKTAGQSFSTNISYNFANAKRGDKIWIYFKGDTQPLQPAASLFTSMDVSITVTSIAFNTVNTAVRIVDVMRYLMKSISGLQINAPLWDSGGQLFNQFLLTGNLLRNKTDEPFYITLKKLAEGILEVKGDYEIGMDGFVNFLTFENFYTDFEMAFFNDTQFSGFEQTFNPRFALNEFNFEYDSYQSQKDESATNTVDGIHGEAQYKFANNNVENKHEVKVGWIRDAFKIEAARKKAIDEADNVANNTDDDIYAIDVNVEAVESMEEFNFTETAFLQHSYDADADLLTLRNTGDFSFSLLGITFGEKFTIGAGQPNAGNYIVVDFDNNFVVLDATTATPSSGNDGERSTKFTYYIDTDDLSGVNWTNEGFTVINNIREGNSFSNMRFSIARVIKDWHSRYLASANIYAKQPLKNTFYKNNPEAFTIYNGEAVTEGGEIVLSDPILSPVLYKEAVFITTFEKFMQLNEDARKFRGFVRFIDNNGFVRKMYVKHMEFSPEKDELNIKEGEEKYTPVVINIVNLGDSITINNEYSTSAIRYEVDGDYIIIKDNEGYLLFNPLMWNRIAINGVTFGSMNELKSNLELL